MQIKRKIITTEQENKLITGLIVSDKFIQDLIPILDVKLLQTTHAKNIARWCIDYYRAYEKAPAKDIQDIYNNKKNEFNADEDEFEIIENFLLNLNEKFEQEDFNHKFFLDDAEKYLASRKLEELSSNVKGLLLNGDIDEAELKIAKHTRTERPQGTSTDVLKDKNKIIEAANQEDDVILNMPGCLGESIGPICRGDFFSVIGPMKRGKTWWLEDFAVRLMLQEKKVLFVSLEMSESQMIKRIYQSFLAQTRREQKIDIPYFDDRNILSKTVQKKGLKANQILKKANALDKIIKNGAFRLICYPSYSANIADVKTEIYNLAYYNNFIADAVIFDYADIMAPEPDSPKDYRHRINHTWMAMRGLAQEINGLCITASQSDRSTFNKNVEEDNTSEDIRKLAHVTHMMALNQTKEDKKLGVMRTTMLASRNEYFSTDDEVVVLYQYGIGKAYLDSRWKKDTNI